MDEFLILLQAGLDEAASKGKINEDIRTQLQGKINDLKIQASIDENSVKSITEQMSKLGIKIGQDFGKAFNNGLSSTINTNVLSQINKISDSSTSTIVQNEKKKQEAYKATSDAVVYHAGVISKLNKAETNGRFYGSSRGTGYFGTGHYFVDSNTKHELDDNSSFSKLPYTSVDISKYDNLFKATTDEIASKLHNFLENLTKFTQGSDKFNIDELFSQFKNVFSDTTIDIKDFGDKMEQLKTFMSNSNLSDRSDSVSTQFMKSLGYGGVDTRGTKYADTRYGTVIYDLKEESVLQANITDELQKQGQMLEKIDYSKGQVFDKETDERIQSQIDGLEKIKEIKTEFQNLFDETNLKNSESELESVKSRLEEIDSIISNCERSIQNAEKEARRFAKETEEFGLDPMSESEIQDLAKEQSASYQERINELSLERAELEKRIPVLEENYNKESQLASEAYKQAEQIVEQRRLEAQHSSSTANEVVQNEEKKQQATQESIKLQSELASLATKKQVDKIQLSLDNGHGASEYQNRIDSIITSLEKYGIEAQEAQNITSSLQSTFDSMKGLSGQELVTQADKLEKEFKAVKVSVDQAKLSYDKLMQPASKEKITSTLVKVQKLLSNNTKVTAEVKNEWQSYVNRLSSGSDIAVKEINDINIRLKETESNMRSMEKLGLSWTDNLKQAWEKFGGWGFATGTLITLYNQLRKVPKEVYEIDTAMTNLYKVTDETSNKYNQFLDSASDSAQDLGRSISSLVEQTANWAKLGFSLDEAEQLAKISSIYANVGEVDNDTAVSNMVTAMKAFNIEASDSITIVNKLNKLGNEYATSAAALGDGLSRSASAMATAGTDINKTLAMLTGGTEITQNASEFGNFLKIGSMRIRGMKGALEELGEEVDETVDSISKVQTQILNRTGGKVNIFDDMGNFRDYYDIMEDISKIYDDLSDPDKADLTEILFGKQRGNQGSALIQAFQSGQIQKALEATMNAEGSAMQEQERWLESLEAKTQQFEAAFQSLSSTVLDSDLLKWFVDFGTGTISTLDTIIDKFGTLNTMTTIGGGIAGAKNLG